MRGTVFGMAPGRRPAPLTLLIAALVAGIFGMHALVAGVGCSATESSLPAGDRATASSPGMAAMGHAGAATGPMTVTVTVKDAPSLPASPVPAGCPDMGGMLMLCIAVLTAAAGALLALLAHRRLKCAWLRAPRRDGTIVRRLLDYARTGPPPVWEFSVIRC